MLVADSYVGHREDDAVADRLADADPVTVVLSDTDRQRSRVRTATADGEDIGIVVSRDLADGDVLEADDTLVVVELATIDALVLSVTDAALSPLAALELGHAVGNRHWDMALRDGEALFPVPDTRERMTAAVDELLPDGIETRFEQVPPTTFDDADADHAHSGNHEHAHASDHAHDEGGHGHSHDHAHGVHTGGEP